MWRYSAVGPLPPRATPFHLDARDIGHIGCRVAARYVRTSRAHHPEWYARMALAAECELAI